ncbi:MAG: hypothetical protein O7C75_01370 [Verrucomicrobia bacterium]|nr:hypothetical protein [Verrucomicrobiota bacterium]
MLVHQLWYSATPLGIDPVLDGRQNLLTAERILNGESFEDPFHRAPLYPYLLALLQKVNVFGLALPSLVRWLNGLAVLATTLMAARLAWLIWWRRYAVWITGLLVGLNPVVIFFAGDPLDITLATTCLTAATFILFLGYKSRDFPWIHWLGGGLVMGLGMAMRSHLLLLGILWPVLAGMATMRNRDTCKLSYILAAACIGVVGPIVSFLGVGFANKAVADEFRITPWGGAYLLWAGNGPMNNGRYYAQSVRVEFDGEYENPTKYESIYQYQQLTGKQPPFEVDEMNSYFMGETFKQIFQDPVTWIRLMFRKAYSLVHNYEQYDNKTFSLHKSFSPYLRINPIGWGFLITLGTLGAGVLCFSRKTTFWGLMVLIFFYSVMILATFTANRYRVPLIPLLAVLAGGVPKLYYRRDQFSQRGIVTISLLGVAATILTFFPLAGIAEKDTYQADYGLLANAAHRQGFDEDAIYWAELALVFDSGRDDLLEVAALSRFNHWFTHPNNTPSEKKARDLLEELEILNRNSPSLAYARGVYLWKLGDQSNACFLWKYAAEQYAHSGSMAALVWNCDVDREFLNTLSSKEWEKFVAIKAGDTGFRAESGESDLTDDAIISFSEMYRIAFAPFISEAGGR